MFDEIRKSINSVMYERVRSPFFGTFAFSWVAWNWRIIYISFFVSEKIIPNKLDFIHKYLFNINHLLLFPFYSSLVFLTLVPFIGNGAFWLSLKFKKWRIDQKNQIENKQLLTIEKSIALREQIRKQEERFQNITEEKDLEISLLKSELIELRKNKILNIEAKPETDKLSVSESKIVSEYSKLFSNEEHTKALKLAKSLIDADSALKGNLHQTMIDFLEFNNIVEKNEMNPYYHSLTDKGKSMYKILLNKELGVY